MVLLNRIYTRTGDAGMTMLGNGEHRKKYDLRVSAYGTVDEVTAAIGVARLHIAETPAIDAMLARIQNDLFDLAADLCSPDKGKGPGGERLAVNAQQVKGWRTRSIRSMPSLRRCARLCWPADRRRRPICILRARSAGAPNA